MDLFLQIVLQFFALFLVAGSIIALICFLAWCVADEVVRTHLHRHVDRDHRDPAGKDG